MAEVEENLLDEHFELKKRLQAFQPHIFEGWETSSLRYRIKFMNELKEFDDHYPGGVEAYVKKAKSLLHDSATGKTPLSGCKVAMPPNIFFSPSFDGSPALTPGSFESIEAEGLEEVRHTVFVLVAGGLGERLGYSGIKVALPVETASFRCYLCHFCEYIREAAGKDTPFVIMTSNDTHNLTLELLQVHNFFGLHPDNVHLLQQQMVPCLGDNEANLAMVGPMHLAWKPHGHGDVHMLINGAGLVPGWIRRGYRNIVFFQDTNAASVLTLPISLAYSSSHNLAMNFTNVPRVPGEAVGALTLVQFPDGRSVTMTVEYNLFGPLLMESTGSGDVPVEGGRYSPFYGSINTLILNLAVYNNVLEETHGVVPEFVNPKYTDKTKTKFKSPARLESLMQDVALLFHSGEEIVGGIVFDRHLYSPVKNSLAEAIAKHAQGLDLHCAATGEMSLYQHARTRLAACGVKIDTNDRTSDVILDGEFPIPVKLFPIVAYDAKFGATTNHLLKHLANPPAVHITARSTLVVRGDVSIRSLYLDGALEIFAAEGASVVVEELKEVNDGWDVVSIGALDDDLVAEVDKIRGFQLVKRKTKAMHFTEPKLHIVRGSVVTTASKI